MKKLEVGDYVKNLTEKQFDNIMKLQPCPFSRYCYVVGRTDELIFEGYYIDFLNGAHEAELETELTYLQFIRRAKNTLK